VRARCRTSTDLDDRRERSESRSKGRRAEPDDAIVAEAGHLAPDGARLVVGRDGPLAAKHGDDQTIGRQIEHLGEELPGEGDGVRFEVVAKAEIAEHLEQGMVARRAADVFEVVVLAAHPHALLTRRRAAIRPLFLAREDVFELHHARVHEHERRVVGGNERRACDDLVRFSGEKIEEGAAYLGGGQGGHRQKVSYRVALPRLAEGDVVLAPSTLPWRALPARDR
jgi:hypothetical protein